MFGRKLNKLYLVGSRSRGTHRPDSDWDILVIADDLPLFDRWHGLPAGPILLPFWCGPLDIDHWVARAVSGGVCFYDRGTPAPVAA